GLTLGLFLSSPVSAVWPTNARYLIGLLVALPALLTPLWGNMDTVMSLKKLIGVRGGAPEADTSAVGGIGAINRPLRGKSRSRYGATIMSAFRIGMLVLIGFVFLLGTISAFSEIPVVQADARQEDALISNLLRIRATHIYS